MNPEVKGKCAHMSPSVKLNAKTQPLEENGVSQVQTSPMVLGLEMRVLKVAVWARVSPLTCPQSG